MCDTFGVSRTAVWKAIKALREEGYEIEAVQNKGYRLVDAPDVMTAQEIASRLNTSWAGCEVHYYDTTGSTNIEAKQFAEQGAPHGTLVIADTQTGGRGRRGHTWQSPSGSSIAMSLVMRPQIPPEKASMLTLVMGLAVADAIRSVSGMETQIKWPNDAVVNKKKVTGILTEMSAEPGYIQYVVIGIGINVNSALEEFPEEIRDMATSLKLECGHQISRAQVITETMRYFEQYEAVFEKTLDLSGLITHYNELLVNRDAQVRVLDPKGDYEGISRGIDAEGNLLVEACGEVRKVNAGEVSVRGLYGYT